MKELSDILKEELSSENIKKRIDPKTTHPFWRKVRNSLGSVSGLAFVISKFNVLPPEYDLIVIAVGVVSGLLSGGAHLDKTNGLLSKKKNLIKFISDKIKKS